MLSRKLFRETIIQQSQTFVQPIELQVWCPEEELPQEDTRPNWSARSGIWEEMFKRNKKQEISMKNNSAIILSSLLPCIGGATMIFILTRKCLIWKQNNYEITPKIKNLILRME